MINAMFFMIPPYEINMSSCLYNGIGLERLQHRVGNAVSRAKIVIFFHPAGQGLHFGGYRSEWKRIGYRK